MGVLFKVFTMCNIFPLVSSASLLLVLLPAREAVSTMAGSEKALGKYFLIYRVISWWYY